MNLYRNSGLPIAYCPRLRSATGGPALPIPERYVQLPIDHRIIGFAFDASLTTLNPAFKKVE
jgi:hypothetical protein